MQRGQQAAPHRQGGQDPGQERLSADLQEVTLKRLNWDKHPQLDRELLSLEAQELSYAEIADAFTDAFGERYHRVFTEDQIRNCARRIQRDLLRDWPVTEIMPYFRKFEDDIRGQGASKLDLPEYLETLGQGRKKALVLEDLHIPFQDEELLQQVVDRHRNADLVILNGDTIDCYSISKYQKKANFPLEVEIDNKLWVCECLSRVFEAVPIIEVLCNHPLRVEKNTVCSQVPSFTA